MAEHLDAILGARENIRVLSGEGGAEYLDGLLRIAQKSIVAHEINDFHHTRALDPL